MSTKAFPRTYKNNSMYAADKLPYIDALALTVQKHLYTKKNAVYFLAGTIELWDFMSLTRYYIIASRSEFGQSDIETYMSSMYDPYAQVLSGNVVEYTKKLDHIILYGAPAMVLSFMWAAWIYAKVLREVCNFDEMPMWQRATEQLYNSMADFYDSPDHKCFGDDNRLLSIADDAVNTMKGYIAEKYPTAKKTQVQQSAPLAEHPVPTNDDSAQLKARIAELEAELEKAKKQVADLEKQNKEQKDNIELLSTDIPEIDAQQKVRMELARKIMSEAGMNAAFMDLRGRKTKVATLMGTLLEIPTHTCASWLSRQELNRETHQKSIKEINDIFEALGLAIRV